MLNNSFGDVEEDNEESSPQAVLEEHSAVPEVSQNLEDKRTAIEGLKRSFSYHR